MANAVVGVFDEYNEAQSTVNELIVAGFDKNEIRLSGEEQAAADAERARKSGGVKGFFKSLFGKEQEDRDILLYDEAVRHGNYVVTAIAETEEKSEIASEVMSHHHPVDIEERSSEWLGPSGSTLAGGDRTMKTEERSIPVIEEEVKVGKREVQRGGVRIFQRVSEVPIEEDVLLREEHVVVERTGGPGYRTHFQQNYATTGSRYEEYLPAYEYGSTAAASDRALPGSVRAAHNHHPTLGVDHLIGGETSTTLPSRIA